MQNSIVKKRIIITSIYVVLFAVIGLILYYVVTPAATCFDKKQNQAEKGVDCGGPCSPCRDIAQTQDIAVLETAIAPGGNNTYDVVAKISNPNDSAGGSSFKYIFTLKDATGAVVATRGGSSFVLPADSKYVAELGIQTLGDVAPVSSQLAISDVQWAKLGDVSKPQLGVYSKKFDKAPTGDGSEAEGVLRNESGYDLNKIFVVIVLRDEKGKIVGVNTTEKNSVRAKEQRDFRITWPYALSGSVQSMEVDAESNVFDPQNFSVSN